MKELSEETLRRIEWREVPPAWRGGILAAARGQARTAPTSLWALLHSLAWPHPYAWGMLAALWLVIVALNFSGPRGNDLYAGNPPLVPYREQSPAIALDALRQRLLVIARWDGMDRHTSVQILDLPRL